MEEEPMDAELVPVTREGEVPAGADDAVAVDSEKARIEEKEDELLSRARKLISKINASQENPNPKHFHALASMLETYESRYLQDSATSSFNGERISHTIGRLASILNENDEFVVSISTKYLSESRYPVSIRAAAARLLLSGSSTWMVFDDTVIENAKNWVMGDTMKPPEDESVWEDESGKSKPTDSEMLKTYATGILSISLTGGGEIVEDVLTSGLSVKLMRFLRLRVLGDLSTTQKDSTSPSENKHVSGSSDVRGREDDRGKSHNVFDTICLDGPMIAEEGSFADTSDDREHGRNISTKHSLIEESCKNGRLSLESVIDDSSAKVVGVYDMVDEDAEEVGGQWQSRNAKSKHVSEDTDENSREDLISQRTNKGLLRSRGKGRAGDSPLENKGSITSFGTELQLGSEPNMKDRTLIKTEDTEQIMNAKCFTSKISFDHETTGDGNDDRFNCIVGVRDISDVVKKAVLAAEAEARVANAPAEAIRAAGDAAVELVKTAALETWRDGNDTEAAVLAAMNAASTIVDAALASEKCSTINHNKESVTAVESKVEVDEDPEDLFILDCESLAQLREKYCIQCLEILGEYLEALGPVLHEKGVDVCLGLLQRCLKKKNCPNNLTLLPEVLKLICALAAHKKFAALFVDRGGIQKLVSVPRNSQTYCGLSSCLFAIGSLQGIMERVCALSTNIVSQLVELTLQLLGCSQDQARKNAALFFGSAFVFRAILDSFDAQEGLQKMLNLLHAAASVRSGGNSGALGFSNSGFQNERLPSEGLSTLEKQIAYHTCVALHQYFRAHLLLLVDSLRPSKSNRSLARNNARAAYKPLDLSNEAIDAVFVQIQRDRKIGPTFVKARWPAVDKFLICNGHITMLELCQAPPGERYLHDLAQYALGVLRIITLPPHCRKVIVSAALSNDRVGMSVILDAANGAGYVDPEVIHPALEVLVNLVCPPPSISIKSTITMQGQQSSITSSSGQVENKEGLLDRSIYDRTLSLSSRSEVRDHNGEASMVERGNAAGTSGTQVLPSSSQTAYFLSGVVGDRRISLGPRAGCAGLAAQLEQGYCQARESVRANNGIKVLLHLLHLRMVTPPGALDRIRALACRVLLGLARDDTIAHILTKLQVGKKLSELLRDSGSQSIGNEHNRWQTELAQVAIELIAIVTNSGRASTLVATDAAAPTLRRIERAAIAAATPIIYHSKELLLLIHEHLQASGLTATASLLRTEASLTPLPSLTVPQPLLHQTSFSETSLVSIQWPSYHASSGLLMDISKSSSSGEDDARVKADFTLGCSRKKQVSSRASQEKNQTSSCSLSIIKTPSVVNSPSASLNGTGHPALLISKPCTSTDQNLQKTPIVLPMKRKLIDSKDSTTPAKRPMTGECFPSPNFLSPKASYRNALVVDTAGTPVSLNSTPYDFSRASLLSNSEDAVFTSTPASVMTPGRFHDLQPANQDRMTLDSLVVQYLKHQHRQCPAPITTLPPLSLLHPHVCSEPSQNLNAPANVTARLGTREIRKYYGGIHAHRRDRQFIYSRFRPWRACRDDASLLTCLAFLGDTSRFVTGTHSGELKIFDSNSGNVLENNSSHQSPIIYTQYAFSGDSQLILSSGSHDVKIWDASSISGGPLHSFEGCKAACFSHSRIMFAALSSETSCREVLLYDIQRLEVEKKFHCNSSSLGQTRGHIQSRIHFSPLDTMLLWNGILWDRRCSTPIHNFDQFTDYGGGGFHPAGNEVIINSEVWDLRKFKLLRSVPSLDQTVISFNAGGDVIYATLRRNVEDITSAVNTRRFRNPLFAAFRTIDATSYSDIATIPVDRCVLDLATDCTNSFVGIVAMDDNDDLFSTARLYEIGRRRPTDDDSDPDDAVDSDEEDEDEDEDSEAAMDPHLDGDDDSDADDLNNDDDIDSGDELDDDADFNIEDMDFDDQELLEMGSEEEDGSELVESINDYGNFADNDFGF